ncbi:hypothetical protein AMECASPLE_016820 [Ameca splendens]|uniref:Secreted protein n=1 Tax=Ameca splendens TaxID=208324 RepID=A0ABV0ZNF5_9TELE
MTLFCPFVCFMICESTENPAALQKHSLFTLFLQGLFQLSQLCSFIASVPRAFEPVHMLICHTLYCIYKRGNNDEEEQHAEDSYCCKNNRKMLLTKHHPTGHKSNKVCFIKH